MKAILDVDPGCVQSVRKNEKTAVHNRARNGSHQIVKALIERDPSVVAMIDKKGQTALHMAAKGKNLDIIEELLDADPSILNKIDKKGNTALHNATRKCRVEVIIQVSTPIHSNIITNPSPHSSQVIQLLLTYKSIEVNILNHDKKTAMDLTDGISYPHQLEIRDILFEAGAQQAIAIMHGDQTSDELRKEVSDLKHELDSQHKQNLKTNRRVTGIAKELRKLHREAIQNTINSVTVVAVLIASIAFIAIFNLPGKYEINSGNSVGQANISGHVAFQVFCLLNATALFISLAVVVVQITLVAWETKAQEKLVKVVNKLMWVACMCICGAFLCMAFVDVGEVAPWMAITVAAVGGPVLVGTLGIMGFLVFRQWFKVHDDSQRVVRRGSGSKSFSWSRYSRFSDRDIDNPDHENRLYVL